MLTEARRAQDFEALLLPFGEAASAFHPDHPGRRYTWAEVRVPRKRELPITEGHDGGTIGTAASFVKTHAGLTAAVRFGQRGQALLKRGHHGLSAELDEDSGELIGIALVVDGEPGFRSAQVFVHADAVPDAPDAPVYFGLDPRTGSIAFHAPQPTAPPRSPTFASGNLSADRDFAVSMSMAAVDRDVLRDRERFAERQEELAREPLERTEMALIGSGLPKSEWPLGSTGRKEWDDFQAHLAAQRIAAEIVEREQRYESEKAARVAVPRRRWWRWWR